MKILSVSDARQACSYCPKLCRHACPTAVVEGTEEATPTYKQQVALLAEEGRVPLDAERARLLYKCTDCHVTVAGACRHHVPVDVSLREARTRAVAEGVAPDEVRWLRERFAETGSPYSADLRARARDALPGVAPAKVARDGLFPGCTALAHAPDELSDAWALLGRAGEDVGLALPRPLCCGYPLDAAGDAEGFRDQAHRVAVALSGFQRVHTLSPTCAFTLDVRYRAIGIQPAFQALPLVDLLAARADHWRRLAPKTPDPRAHAYHDPCFLGRRLGRYEEPRTALSAALGAAPLELGYRREHALCAGGGGVYPLTHPKEATGCAGRVLALARETPAEVLVTACPSARRQLQKGLEGSGPEVKSLVNVLAERTR